MGRLNFNLNKLTSLVDFIEELEKIIKPYYDGSFDGVSEDAVFSEFTNLLINELEAENIKRLIDGSLDEKDAKSFGELIKLL